MEFFAVSYNQATTTHSYLICVHFIIAECPPGTYGNVEDGVHVCSECPKGMYQTLTGQTRCISCPANTTTQFTGTRSDSRCYCE